MVVPGSMRFTISLTPLVVNHSFEKEHESPASPRFLRNLSHRAPTEEDDICQSALVLQVAANQ